MRRGGAGLIAAVLALAGCKNTGGPKPTDRDPAGTPAARAKGKDARDAKGPTWLDPVAKLPGADTTVPKAGPTPDPKGPGSDARAVAQDALGGKVVDESGRAAKNVFIRVEPVGGAPRGGAALGISADNDGYFVTRGLKAGEAYALTAEASRDGRRLSGTVQTRVPNPVLTIVLREDQGLPPVGSDGPPPPADADRIPPTGLGPNPAPKRPADGAFAPGGGASGRVPATIGGTPAPRSGDPLPPPDFDSVPARPVARPENVADGPKPPWQTPTVNIPGPPVPTYPVPPPAPAAPARVRPGANFRLVDTMERDWDFATDKSGSVVLVEFVTTACPNCKPAVPVLKDVQARYGAAGLQVVAVLCDEGPQRARAEAARAYARANDVNYPVYTEPGPRPGAVRDKLGVESYPAAVLLDATGAVLWTGHPGRRAELEAAIRKALGK